VRRRSAPQAPAAHRLSRLILVALPLALLAAVIVFLLPASDKAEASASPAAAQPAARVVLTPAELLQVRGDGWPAELHSLLNVPRQLKYGEFVWDEHGVAPGRLSVRVDLDTQLISVFRGGHEIGTAVILYGADSHVTPIGTFPVLEKLRDHRSRTYDNAPMPYTLRLTADGVAVHGSDVRSGRATHGCVGLPLEFARLLFEQASTGDEITITATPSPGRQESPRPI
jgi:hypothetical protein